MLAFRPQFTSRAGTRKRGQIVIYTDQPRKYVLPIIDLCASAVVRPQ